MKIYEYVWYILRIVHTVHSLLTKGVVATWIAQVSVKES